MGHTHPAVVYQFNLGVSTPLSILELADLASTSTTRSSGFDLIDLYDPLFFLGSLANASIRPRPLVST